MYGGAAMTFFQEDMSNAAVNDATDFDEVYVLTLPAFVWSKADYPAQLSRIAHTCTVLGGQMITYGGGDPTDHSLGHHQDPFTHGLGVFDLCKMQWANSFDPASVYNTPDIVASYYYSK
jgi:hypothetical protein